MNKLNIKVQNASDMYNSIKIYYAITYILYKYNRRYMQITKQDDIITIDNVDFKQSKSWPKYYVSKLGSYVTATLYRH